MLISDPSFLFLSYSVLEYRLSAQHFLI